MSMEEMIKRVEQLERLVKEGMLESVVEGLMPPTPGLKGEYPVLDENTNEQWTCRVFDDRVEFITINDKRSWSRESPFIAERIFFAAIRKLHADVCMWKAKFEKVQGLIERQYEVHTKLRQESFEREQALVAAIDVIHAAVVSVRGDSLCDPEYDDSTYKTPCDD